MTSVSSLPPTGELTGGSLDPFQLVAGRGQNSQGISLNTFLVSLVGAFVVFAAQIAVFLLLKGKLRRIYRPRTFLVPERERTQAPPSGLWQWILPVFQTSNTDFIHKCGLDAYFFLRYLRTLVKIFAPLAFLILPILLPLNLVYGRGAYFAVGIYGANDTLYTNVTGLDQLAWGNVHPDRNHRYWAHLILAVVVIGYACYVFFDELKGYIRLRQAYLTSPQHRLRASATTVLVTGIPTKWCTFQALNGLYDVFPGGVRNIWVNRNYDELNEKVKLRTKIAGWLEGAETSLIRKAKKAYLKKLKAHEKTSGQGVSREERVDQEKAAEGQGLAMADTAGVSAGNPHQPHTLGEVLGTTGVSSQDQKPQPQRPMIPIPALGQGINAIGHQIDTVGRTLVRGLKQVGKDVNGKFNDSPGQVLNNQDRADGTTDVPQGADSDQGTYDRYGPQSVGDRPATDASGDAATNPASAESPVLPASSNDFEMDGGSDNPPADKERETSATDQTPPQDQEVKKPKRLGFWFHDRLDIPSPTPHGQEEDEFPLSNPSPTTPGGNPPATINSKGAKSSIDERKPWTYKSMLLRLTGPPKPAREYPVAYDKRYNPADDGEPAWKRYLREQDRETMRLPIFGWTWMPSLPLLGRKVDTIYYCRKELARLNVEIEQDQRDPQKFPLMNSAFVQFNHQVAAHMACQSVSHHMPNQMTPRMVEISPDDVLWDNMSIKWWQSYLRTGVVLVAIVGLIIGWAFPVTFTGLLSQIQYLQNYKHLEWLKNIPDGAKSFIQGILPPFLLALLLGLLPTILRLLARTKGSPTGMSVELTVQNYYFAFLFVQVFLVVSISSGVTTVLSDISQGPQNIPSILAGNLPKASNYFFSYMILQAFSVSAAALVQLLALFKWFVLAPIFDNTARQKWARQTKLPDVRWGTFFPVYTNLAAIGLIYSIISPLIMVFNIITFSLFWLVYRYNTLYVTKFRFDTGGLLYPKAINQLFTGLYVMELCLIGLFFLVRDSDEFGRAVGTPCKGQAIIMIVVLLCTIIYQWLLNRAFGPLLKYLPITLEDDAVIQDQYFAKLQEKRWNHLHKDQPGKDINTELTKGTQWSADETKAAAMAYEMRRRRFGEGPKARPSTSPRRRTSTGLRTSAESTTSAESRTSAGAVGAGGRNKELRLIRARRRAGRYLYKGKQRAMPETSKEEDEEGESTEKEARDTTKEEGGDTAKDKQDETVEALKEDEIVEEGTNNSVRDAMDHSVTDATDNIEKDKVEDTVEADEKHENTEDVSKPKGGKVEQKDADTKKSSIWHTLRHLRRKGSNDVEAGPNATAEGLFAGLSDEIEDLTPDERDRLVRHAFQHEALRAKRPVIWIPRDEMGVSDDEIYQTQKYSKHIWISNEYSGLDRSCRVVYRRSPPDFSEVDLIEL